MTDDHHASVPQFLAECAARDSIVAKCALQLMHKGYHCESLVECIWVSILAVVGSGLEVSIPLSAELICQTLFEPMFPPPLTTGSSPECTYAVPFRPLVNQGNECFINASMQALLVVPAMRHQCARIHREFTSQNINLSMRHERSFAKLDCDLLVAEACKLCSQDLVYDSPVHLSELSNFLIMAIKRMLTSFS